MRNRKNNRELAMLDCDVYSFVRHYTEVHHEPPESIGAVCRGMDVKWASVYCSIERLIKRGALARDRRNRAPVRVR